jgi:hypothetical protein
VLACRWATALVGSAVFVLAAGCSGSPGSTNEAGVSGYPPSPPTASTTTPDPDEPTAPVMPDLARQRTTLGAKAFVRYYVQVLNYSHDIGSGKHLRSLAANDCLVCHDFQDNIDEMEAHGGGQVGGHWKVQLIRPLPAGSADLRNLSSTVLVRPGTTRRTSASVIMEIKSRVVFIDFYLTWHRPRWVISNVVPWS